jgi:uncharacterized protein (TIGR00661 family)
LDWGLGHATRCIPIIRALLGSDYEVVIAASGPSAVLLKAEFPLCTHLASPAAQFSYSRKRMLFALSIIAQIPKLFKLAKQETQWLKKVVQEYNVRLIISDNRFGMYHHKIPSVFITHQLGLKSGISKWIDQFIQQRKYKTIRHFTECWVPDIQGSGSLAGELSHPRNLPDIPIHFIGVLSRMQCEPGKDENGKILIVLSGPEPQRTIFEEIINEQLPALNEKIVFVRGLPGAGKTIARSANTEYYDHLPADRLSEEVNKASLVICRSGYSSIMDLLKLGKKGIYVPTPGQPEQEYLGRRLTSLDYGVVISQKNFVLNAAIDQARQFAYKFPQIEDSKIFPERISHLMRMQNNE